MSNTETPNHSLSTKKLPPMNTSKKLTKLLKTLLFTLFGAVFISTVQPQTAMAQDIDTGVDFYSTYVFRGVAFSGPSLQPYVEVATSGFSIGAWGSQGYDGFQEMDLYAGYTFDFGLYLGITDYYYPGTPFFSVEEDPANGNFGSHAFELNAGYEIEGIALSGNFIFNEASGAGSAGGDLYFEAGYTLGSADVFIGAGDGWHSSDGDFALVNIGVSTSKELKITDTFSIPLSGAVILNPDSEQLYILAGVSF